ncbi:MAG: hypothetical protein ABW032_01840, partial [Burkholderiaceae bacterium]
MLITVHGIRTFGQWQERLGALARGGDGRLGVEHFKYGYFSVLAFALPPLRWLAVRSFRRSLVAAAARYPGHELLIVGHSNGTYLIGQALRQAKDELRGRVGTVILAGSVLRSDFDWERVIAELGIERVVNDCGTEDAILVLSQLGVLFTGMAGRLGFHGMTGSRLHNRYFPGGHSHYFERDGRADDAFMARYWVPALLHGDVEAADFRRRTGALHGTALWLLQNADFVKLTAYATVLAAAFFVLYLAPRAQASAQRALRVQEFAASALNEEVFPERALLDLAGELDREPRGPLQAHWQTLAYYLPRMLNLRTLTAPRGVYTFIRRDVETWVHAGGRFLKAAVGQDDWRWLADDDALVAISEDGRLRHFAPGRYAQPASTIDLSRSPWVEFSPEAADPTPHPIPLTKIRLSQARLVPGSDPGVLNIVFGLGGIDKGAVKLLGDEFDHGFGLVHYNLRTRQARGYVIPGTSAPDLGNRCGVLLYLGYPESFLVLHPPGPHEDDPAQLKAPKRRSAGAAGRMTDAVQVPVLALAPHADDPPQLRRVSLGQARAYAWDRSRLDEATARCAGVEGTDQRANLALNGFSPRIPFPYMYSEVDSWTQAEAPVRRAPGGNAFQPLDGDARRALGKASMAPDRDPAERAEAAEWLKDKEILYESVAVQPDGAKVYLQQTASKNFGISAWRLSRVGADGRTFESIASLLNNYDEPFTMSASGRFLASRTERELSGASAVVLDVRTMSGITLEATPDQYIVAAAFDRDDGELALLGASGTLMRLAMPSGRLLGTAVVRSSTFRDPGHSFVAESVSSSSMAYVGRTLMIQTQGGSVLALAPDTTDVLWWSKPLPGLGARERLRFGISPDAEVVAV